jgi:peptide/nickel transport system substrate-binding protein
MAALLAAVLFIACAAPAFADSPVNMTVSPGVAGSLEKIPEKSRQRVDTIVVGVPDLFGQTNPLFANTLGDTYAAELLFDEWVFLDEYGAPGEGMARMSVSPDGLTYTFELKPARYSDLALVSADDCLNTLYLITMPGFDGSRDLRPLDVAGLAEYIDGTADTVSGFQKLSETSFSVTLNKPNASAPALLALPALRVAHFGSAVRPAGIGSNQIASAAFYERRIKEIREADAWLAGYGQYDIVSIEPGQRAVFTANEDYWRAKPSTGTFELKVVPIGEEYEAMLSGDVDIISCFPDIAQIEKVYDSGDGFVSLYTWLGDSFGYLEMRAGNPLFDDARVRRAFAYGLRRKSILQEMISNYAELPGMLLFDSFDYKSDVLGELYPYDSEASALLMDEAGWIAGEDGKRTKDGAEFSFTFIAAEENPMADIVIREIQSLCDYLGLTVDARKVSFSELTTQPEADMYLQARRIPTSPAIAANLFAGGSPLNDSGYDSEGVERFMNWASLETNPARQSIVYEGMFQQLYLELPMIPLYRRFELLLVNARIRNFYVSSGHDITAEAYRMIITTAYGDE